MDKVLIYGMGATKLKLYAKNSYGVELTEEQAYEYRNKYFSRYQGLTDWHQRSSQKIRGGAVATYTLSGRRRSFSRIRGAANEIRFTSYVNTQDQGTGGDITKVAIALCHSKFKGTGVKMILQVHDELVLEAPDHLVEWAESTLVDCMIRAGKYFLQSVPVAVESSHAETWGKAK